MKLDNKMKEYFKLQYLMTKRKLSDGSHPIVGYLLALFILLVFVGVSMLLLYSKLTYAPYIYAFVSLFFTLKSKDTALFADCQIFIRAYFLQHHRILI